MMDKTELHVLVVETKICTTVVGMFMLKYSVRPPEWKEKDLREGHKLRLRAREEGWWESNGRNFELRQKLLR